MAARKRKSARSRRTGFVGRAMSAGRMALREAESRVPTDLRREVERRLHDADKAARAAIKTLQTQVKKASTRADVNSVLKRIDGLAKQARQIARTGPGSRRATTTRRAATTRKRAASTKRAATRRTTTSEPRTSTARRSTAASTRTTRRSTTTRRTPARRRAPAASSIPVTMPMGPGLEPAVMVVETGESGS